jgi:FMN phosphatase YigB (HAD superfamily)
MEKKKITNTKFIALDIGNVCVSLRYDKCFDALNLSHDTEVPESFISILNLLERGKISIDSWLNNFSSVTGGKFTKKELIVAYNRILGEEIAQTAEFVREAVKHNFRVIFLSNISEVHAIEIYERLSFAHLISGAVFSYEVGYMKPELQIYEKFSELYGKPELFIDGKKENRHTAQLLGWNTVEAVPCTETLLRIKI